MPSLTLAPVLAALSQLLSPFQLRQPVGLPIGAHPGRAAPARKEARTIAVGASPVICVAPYPAIAAAASPASVSGQDTPSSDGFRFQTGLQSSSGATRSGGVTPQSAQSSCGSVRSLVLKYSVGGPASQQADSEASTATPASSVVTPNQPIPDVGEAGDATHATRATILKHAAMTPAPPSGKARYPAALPPRHIATSCVLQSMCSCFPLSNSPPKAPYRLAAEVRHPLLALRCLKSPPPL